MGKSCTIVNRLPLQSLLPEGQTSVSSVPPEDPLDYIDMDDVIQHGDPSKWTFCGPKAGSPVPAASASAPPGTMKHYDLYEDEFGDDIEVHYFRHPDGTVSDVKIKSRT